ncbi:MAG: ClbS/DfsB family four-helix bundle protein, partial [Chloroflexi bacterium]|nr:ClbS/DfsB family four-helix bundle protein [Chloroflexota bacterium]
GERIDVSKDELLGAFAEAHDDLLIAADAAVTRGDPHGADGWGVREVLTHIAGWEVEATQRLPQLMAGAPARDYDVDTFNVAAVAAHEGQSLHEVRASLEQAYARLVTLLDGLDEAAFAPGGVAWEWVTALTRHNHEHARALMGGRERLEETE